MITVQVVEREGSGLYQTLKEAMRSGDLRTFSLSDRGRRVVHVSAPGSMKWTHSRGTIICDLPIGRSGENWQLLSKWVGRLADRYAHDIQSISIRFLAPAAKTSAAKARRTRG